MPPSLNRGSGDGVGLRAPQVSCPSVLALLPVFVHGQGAERSQ